MPTGNTPNQQELGALFKQPPFSLQPILAWPNNIPCIPTVYIMCFRKLKDILPLLKCGHEGRKKMA